CAQVVEGTDLTAQLRNFDRLDPILPCEIPHVALIGAWPPGYEFGRKPDAVDTGRGEHGVDGRPADVQARNDADDRRRRHVTPARAGPAAANCAATAPS